MTDALCIGAHPDDVEIGMGATVAKMARAGLSVTLLDLTDGEPTPRGTHDTRLAEAAEAAGILGVGRITLDLPNRELFDTVESRRAVAEVVRDLAPRMLFVPYPVDVHPDHVAAAQIALAARFWAKLVKSDLRGEPAFPERVYRYLAVHQRVIAEPSFVVDVAETLEVKMRALAAYRSQFADNERNAGVLPMVERSAAMWGDLARLEAGEPFFAIEAVGVDSPAALL